MMVAITWGAMDNPEKDLGRRQNTKGDALEYNAKSYKSSGVVLEKVGDQ